MCSGSETGSYLMRIDSCITQLKAQGPTGSCNGSKDEGKHLGERLEDGLQEVVITLSS